ncbi:MAG: hypothetical protein KC910_17755 [Candidatus Eremiobacteraeota bacterium]|nr:hypothetical protein [Candidatus Eremiobacteraeota bacterium]
MSIAALMPSTVDGYERALLSEEFSLGALQVLQGLVSPGGHREAHLLEGAGQQWLVKASAGSKRSGRRIWGTLDSGFGPSPAPGLAQAVGMETPALACRFEGGALLVSRPADERLVERAANYLGRQRSASREGQWRAWVRAELGRASSCRRSLRDSLHKVPCQELTVARLEFELMAMGQACENLESADLVAGAMTRAAVHLRELLSGPLAEPASAHLGLDGHLSDLLEALERQLGPLTACEERGRVQLPAYLEPRTRLLVELLAEAGCGWDGTCLSLPAKEKL